ncbi:N-acetylglucosaminyl transferase component Gpi1 [Pyronema domesticum]|nr:N-acetylglucosaminyl transferase component Gpi1 [Pyronema domesticum]
MGLMCDELSLVFSSFLYLRFCKKDICNIYRDVWNHWLTLDCAVMAWGCFQSTRIDNELRSGSFFRKSRPSIDRIFDICGQQELCVLGDVNGFAAEKEEFHPEYLHTFTHKSSRYPQIYCPSTSGVTMQVILFEEPDPRRMEFHSLTPISLALEDNGADGENDDMEIKDREKQELLVEKLKQHTVTRIPPTEKEESLQMIIHQINCTHETTEILRINVELLNSRRYRRALSVSERVVESAHSVWRTALGYGWALVMCCFPWVVNIFVIIMLFWRYLAHLLLLILEWRLKPELAALKDISATAQQCDIRLQQFCYWPLQYDTVRQRKGDLGDATNSYPHYIRFYNSLWLVANDIIIGIALGSYLIENGTTVADTIDYYLKTYTIDGLGRTIQWLLIDPGGLKLNEELDRFLGDLFGWVLNYWADITMQISPWLPTIIYAIGISSFAGASMPIALFSDLLSILTIHIYSFYIASARIYNWQLSIIYSLFHLFRGKKINVLRKRIDSCDYELDQLLIGTTLFILLIFLLPTVMVYYCLFAASRMAIIILKAALETCLACLNHFPLFALMLRVKDSKRLPGGIMFELKDPVEVAQGFQHKFDTAPIAYIHLKSTPLPLSAMFKQYSQLGMRLKRHYFSARVISCLLTGKAVPPIHRRNLYSMQYSMLPTVRAHWREVWERLRK